MGNLKEFVRRMPVIGRIARKIQYRKIFFKIYRFPGSESYWDQRYLSGGDSGVGSYGKFAEFKAEILNDFVRENGVMSIIEYGCGDGNQLKGAAYPRYLGFDVSPAAISMCKRLFDGDSTKQFRAIGEYSGETAELTLSLDVIYHLVEDDVFESYMRRLFESATRFVIVFSSNTDKPLDTEAAHVRHRRFTSWIETNSRGWTLAQHIPNKFPYEGDHRKGSFADFYIYRRGGGQGSLG